MLILLEIWKFFTPKRDGIILDNHICYIINHTAASSLLNLVECRLFMLMSSIEFLHSDKVWSSNINDNSAFVYCSLSFQIISLWNPRLSLACDILRNYYEAFALYSFGRYLIACLGKFHTKTSKPLLYIR